MMNLLVSAILILSLSGCLKTRADLRGDGGDTAQTKQLTAAQRARAQEVASRPPPVTLKLDEHDDQLRNLNGRVDTLENALNQQSSVKGADAEASVKERAALNQRLLAYEEALKKLEATVQAQNDEISRLKAPPPAVSAKANPKAAFDDAEDLFEAKKYKEAILAYQKYRDANAKGKHYAEATYKIGASFQELGMKDEARAFFEELKDKFPGSKDAKKAVARLKTLK